MSFKNTAPIDFTIKDNRSAFQAEVEKIQKKSLKAFPIIAGKEIQKGEVYIKTDANDGKSIASETVFADKDTALNALKKLNSFSITWRAVSLEKRSLILKKAAEIMTKRRNELSAIIVKETAKNWYEADRDTVEAIDFCNYYAESALTNLAPFDTQKLPGETNQYSYEGLGTAVVIGPWNFPLAIPCGMLAASLVAGNTAALKPAEQSSYITYEMVKIFLEAGLPTEAVAFLPGRGEEIGVAMTESPNSQLICFTGSLAVGESILKSSSQLSVAQGFIKKTILELGGKNAIIIDEDADLDETIKGVLYSAFAYAGQKCSACSRIIVVGTAYENFIKRFIPAAKDLIIGKSYNPESFLTPVIDREAQERILNTIAEGKKDTKILYSSEVPKEGFFVPLTIFDNPNLKSSLWENEIFGPVVCIKQAKKMEEAISMLNNSKYALTAGLFSRSPANIALAKKTVRAGNFYINRSCTGAIVERQPFGGFKLSGIGSKAGGPDYLKQFVVPKVITENIMRRGFVPES